MGVVYRARNLHLERDVALRMLPAGALTDDAARRRFRREALALSQLSHPNIATMFDFDTCDGLDFLIMELVTGETLDRRARAGGIPERELIPIALQIAAGLAAAHGRGVIHCDLKPANLGVTPDGFVKILDFGIARLLQPESGRTATATLAEPAGARGTPLYMAPEVIGGQPPDVASDLYAFGVVLYDARTLEMDPGFGPMLLFRSWPELALGRTAEAIADLEAAGRTPGMAVLTEPTLAFVRARAGDSAGARAGLDAVLDSMRTRHVPAYLIALVYEALGERDAAFAWLDRAFEERDHWLVFLDVESRFDSLRGDPCFTTLRERVGVGSPAGAAPPAR